MAATISKPHSLSKESVRFSVCGLLLSKQGLGAGIVFDYGTTLMTAIIVVIATIYVVYGLYTYKTEEVNVLYERLHIKQAEEC